MLAGGAFMFVAAAVPARLVGFWLSNTGEVALGLALVLTERFLQSREASGGADSGAGSRGERA
jgi:hypothetical protein